MQFPSLTQLLEVSPYGNTSVRPDWETQRSEKEEQTGARISSDPGCILKMQATAVLGGKSHAPIQTPRRSPTEV